MEDLKKEQWEDHCKKNCGESYGMAIDLAILLLWESDAIVANNEQETLKGLHLSGNQFESAVSFASHYKPIWLIKVK